jgi:hypothetical protein
MGVRGTEADWKTGSETQFDGRTKFVLGSAVEGAYSSGRTITYFIKSQKSLRTQRETLSTLF